MTPSVINLARGGDLLAIVPDAGGSILFWTRRGMHLLRRPSPTAPPGGPGATGCFPLVPFCNRIAWRRFTWAGQTYELAANFGDHPHAIHGVGWQRPWLVEDVSGDAAALTLRHEADGAWPFPFTSRLTYSLSEQGLTMEIEATNLHSAPAPMGIGAHPWFPRVPGAAITCQADGVWSNRDALPVSHGPAPANWDHSHGRAVDGEMLDNCFTGWNGEARLPGMRIKADPVFSNLQIYTPTGADFFCVEPVSHVPDAINRPDLQPSQAMTVLQPGETSHGAVTFRVDGEPAS